MFKRLAQILVVLMAMAVPARAQNGPVIQGFTLQCTDTVNLLSYSVNYWGPTGCVPPSPYDMVGRPNTGWGTASACTTGGSFDCAPGDTFDGMFPATNGIGVGDTSNVGSALSISTTLTGVPGASVNGIVIPSATWFPSELEKTVRITVAGSLVLNTTLGNQVSTVDVSLQRESPAGTFTTLTTRRVTQGSGNPTSGQTSPVGTVNMEYIDHPPTGGVYSYRVAVKLISNSGPTTFIGDNNDSTRTRIVATHTIH